MGKAVLEHAIHDELAHLMRELGSCGADPVDPGTWLTRAASNVICSLIYGERFDYDDKVRR